MYTHRVGSTIIAIYGLLCDAACHHHHHHGHLDAGLVYTNNTECAPEILFGLTPLICFSTLPVWSSCLLSFCTLFFLFQFVFLFSATTTHTQREKRAFSLSYTLSPYLTTNVFQSLWDRKRENTGVIKDET